MFFFKVRCFFFKVRCFFSQSLMLKNRNWMLKKNGSGLTPENPGSEPINNGVNIFYISHAFSSQGSLAERHQCFRPYGMRLSSLAMNRLEKNRAFRAPWSEAHGPMRRSAIGFLCAGAPRRPVRKKAFPLTFGKAAGKGFYGLAAGD